MRGDVSGRGNPVWMQVLKLGKVVNEIAEHVVEKCVPLGILIHTALSAEALYAEPFL